MSDKLTIIRGGGSSFYLPALYQRDVRWALKTPYATAANRYIIVSPTNLTVDCNGTIYSLSAAQEIDLSNAANWDTITPTDYTAAAARVGKDFYIYVVTGGGLLLSAASTYPSGYSALTSRKIGGFHCVCVAVGTISGHTLTGFVAGDVLPASIWDLNHKPKWSNPEGMVFSDQANIWVDIYLASGTGVSTASVNGGTISDSRDWNDFTDDGAAVKKRMLRDREFQTIAAGCNEKTNITGSADPVTTGGHVDTAARRMLSNIGAEDCAGVMYQWLDEQSFRCDPDGTVQAAALTFNVTYAASPGGNQVYLKYDNNIPYLCCNMASAAVDKWIGPTNYKVKITHDANANTGLPVYFDDDGTASTRLKVNNTLFSKDVLIPTNNPTYFLQISHSATASTIGTVLNYDDGADDRLESANAGGVTATADLALNSQAFGWQTLGGNKGSLYKQGTYGDVKLLAGLNWSHGTSCGSRGRNALTHRWFTYTTLGCRFCAEPV